MLHELAGAGWEWRQAETCAENNCLVNILLQNLGFYKALVGEHESLTVDERQSACLACIIVLPLQLSNSPVEKVTSRRPSGLTQKLGYSAGVAGVS